MKATELRIGNWVEYLFCDGSSESRTFDIIDFKQLPFKRQKRTK